MIRVAVGRKIRGRTGIVLYTMSEECHTHIGDAETNAQRKTAKRNDTSTAATTSTTTSTITIHPPLAPPPPWVVGRGLIVVVFCTSLVKEMMHLRWFIPNTPTPHPTEFRY